MKKLYISNIGFPHAQVRRLLTLQHLAKKIFIKTYFSILQRGSLMLQDTEVGRKTTLYPGCLPFLIVP
ncbi:MAG TPA: hypothetical protein VFN30_07380 [Chitinophagaceae bacterium]|nr:hypothetical protein [Chitinophagaceae bacterium]